MHFGETINGIPCDQLKTLRVTVHFPLYVQVLLRLEPFCLSSYRLCRKSLSVRTFWCHARCDRIILQGERLTQEGGTLANQGLPQNRRLAFTARILKHMRTGRRKNIRK